MSRAVALVALALGGACQRPAAQPGAKTEIESCEYRLRLHATGRVDVSVGCEANGELALRVASEHLAPDVHGPAPGPSGAFRTVERRLSYRVELAALSARSNGFDSAQRVGDSFVAAMSSVLLVPEPLTAEIPVTVRVAAADGVKVAVGLARGAEAGSYRLMAHEIPVATYFAFGKLEQRELRLPGGTLEITKLDGALDQSFADVARWVGASAEAVAAFYGGFPVPRAGVTLIPAPGRDSVVVGKVLPESAPGIALVLGQHAPRAALYGDWILVHELFHLGFPSFLGEGKWLDEGLATYYEPIIRVRAGLYTELEMWNELERSMPQGLPAFTQLGLERATDFRGVYWGGAVACLVADVEARKRDRERGLEVGLRALNAAGGNASEVWSLADAIATVDRALGAPTLAPLAERHAQRGGAFDLARLFDQLGVRRSPDGRIQLVDSAPLAGIRRAITRQPPRGP